MDRIGRLSALRRTMMGSFDVVDFATLAPRASGSPPRASGSPVNEIATLRRALAAEHAARVAAEARLARVLAEVSAQVRNAHGAPAPAPSVAPVVPERRRLVSRIVSATPDTDPEPEVKRQIDWNAITDNEDESEEDDG